MADVKHTPWIDRAHPGGMGGTQQVYRFDNGFGASVVRFYGSYGHEDGLYELAVVKFDGDKYRLTYETPITSDVLGHLTESDVQEQLDAIAALPA